LRSKVGHESSNMPEVTTRVTPVSISWIAMRFTDESSVVSAIAR
jgi:hypothetical protein